MIHPHDRAVSSGHGGLAPAASRPHCGGLIAHTQEEEVAVADKDGSPFILFFIFYILSSDGGASVGVSRSRECTRRLLSGEGVAGSFFETIT